MRHITYRGRVVYDRAKHYFSDRDLKRIVDALSKQTLPQKKDPSLLAWILDLLEKINLYLLRRIFALAGAEAFADVVYFAMKKVFDNAVRIGGGPSMRDFIERNLPPLDLGTILHN